MNRRDVLEASLMSWRQTRTHDHYEMAEGSCEVTRLNPALATRGHLIPGEPLYVRMPVSDRRIERELMTLRDDRPIYEAPAGYIATT